MQLTPRPADRELPSFLVVAGIILVPLALILVNTVTNVMLPKDDPIRTVLGFVGHPYLAGERAPLWNANLRGSFFGLAMHHRKEHLIRAVLEGVIFNLYSILPAVEALIGPTRTMKATGGFARSGLWRQMMADIFNREVVVPESFESSCLGAAVLGLYALGRVDSLNVIAGMVGATHRHAPMAGNVAIYQRLLPIYLGIPAKLEQEYRAIAAFQRELSATEPTGGAASPPMTEEV